MKPRSDRATLLTPSLSASRSNDLASFNAIHLKRLMVISFSAEKSILSGVLCNRCGQFYLVMASRAFECMGGNKNTYSYRSVIKKADASIKRPLVPSDNVPKGYAHPTDTDHVVLRHGTAPLSCVSYISTHLRAHRPATICTVLAN